MGTVIQIIPEGRRITTLTKMQDQLRQAYEELEQRVVERTDELKRSNERLQREITERKQAEEARHEKQRELETSQAQLQDLASKLFTAQDSERQREVLQLIAEGKSTRSIAAILDISIKTVEFHRTRIMEELNLHSTADLTKYAVSEGLVSL